jgi:hypothetical protein
MSDQSLFRERHNMADFNINTFTTTAQALANGEFGFVGQSGGVSTSSGTSAVTASGSFEITVLGAVAANGNVAILSSAASTASLTTGVSGSIISADSAAVAVTASSNLIILNAGLIAGRSTGISSTGTGTANFILENTGTIKGFAGRAVDVSVGTGNVKIINSGDILSAGSNPTVTIVASGAAVTEFTNSGFISASELGDPSISITTQGVTILRNSGTLAGGITVSNATTTQTVLTNSGLIQGDVTTGSGADIFDLRGGLITGAVSGGDGSDVYFIDDAGINLTESLLNGDIDTISTLVTMALPAGFERLILRGTADINGSVQGNVGVTMLGNTGDNRLAGGTGNDVIFGDGGQDTLIGNRGDDNYTTSGQDMIIEAANGGIDQITLEASIDGQDTYTMAANVENILVLGDYTSIVGNASSNIINAGNLFEAITLDGGGGVDVFTGSAGDTTFITDGGDTIADSAGIDTVVSSASFSLTADLENLTLSGSAAINGVGTAGNNTIIGNGARNTLNGLGGSDVMSGGAGNDIYVTDGGDLLNEAAAAGTDTVRSSVTQTLGVNFENLVLTGALVANGTGNDVANTIVGNAAANVLNGGDGSDKLSGGNGADVFEFTNAIAAGNLDRITDFAVGLDDIHLENAIFVGLAAGGLAISRFAANALGDATTASQRIIYETDTGKLFFDADGSGAGLKQQFATLATGLALTNADFFVI